MIVHYYEGSALANPGNPPGQEVTLDDRHKAAWRLFSGNSHYSGGQRNFVFRAEPLGSNRDLFMLRSAEPFQGGSPCEITLEAGGRLVLEWLMSPTIATGRVKTSTHEQRGKHIPAPREDWPAVASLRLAGAGLGLADPEGVEVLGATGVRHSRRCNARFTVARFRAAVIVDDPIKAATAWLNGIGRKKGYGMGMLCLVES